MESPVALDPVVDDFSVVDFSVADFSVVVACANAVPAVRAPATVNASTLFHLSMDNLLEDRHHCGGNGSAS
jgi:hypothetical protein